MTGESVAALLLRAFAHSLFAEAAEYLSLFPPQLLVVGALALNLF